MRSPPCSQHSFLHRSLFLRSRLIDWIASMLERLNLVIERTPVTILFIVKSFPIEAQLAHFRRCQWILWMHNEKLSVCTPSECALNVFARAIIAHQLVEEVAIKFAFVACTRVSVCVECTRNERCVSCIWWRTTGATLNIRHRPATNTHTHTPNERRHTAVLRQHFAITLLTPSNTLRSCFVNAKINWPNVLGRSA